MVMSARKGEGVSSVASSLAVLMSGRAARPVWLLDLDFLGNQQFRLFQAKTFSRFGAAGRALDGSLNAPPFFQIMPQIRAVDGNTRGQQKYLAVHKIEHSNLLVSRFRTEILKPGQKIQVSSRDEYWRALRSVSDWAIVDGLSIDHSSAGLSLCRHIDGVILVVEADSTQASEVNTLRNEIEAHGGRCLGVVVNRVRSDARMADRLSL